MTYESTAKIKEYISKQLNEKESAKKILEAELDVLYSALAFVNNTLDQELISELDDGGEQKALDAMEAAIYRGETSYGDD